MAPAQEATTGKRYFNLEEAELLLPNISKLLKELQALNEAIDLLDSIEVEVDEEDYPEIAANTSMNKKYHEMCYEVDDGFQGRQRIVR